MPALLLVDDDPAISRALARGLRYEGFEVVVAATGPAALAAARDQPPDLVILDWMLPELDGLEVLRRLRAGDARLPVLMLTARDAPHDEVQGLGAGADDYLVKPFTFEVLLARVRALLRRAEAERAPLLAFADLTLEPSSRHVQRGERAIALTPTEYDLLWHLMQQPHHVLTRAELMERVWGYDFGGNDNVLETYIKQLRQKLEAGGEPRLIHTVRGVGYTLRES